MRLNHHARSPKNMLVTGAAGFIGCHFVRFLLNTYNDIQVISYDKLTYAGSLDNLHDVMENPRHVFIQGDINDAALVLDTLRRYKIDTLVHFAAESHVDHSIARPDIFIQTNVQGTHNLLVQAKRYWLEEKVLDTSSCLFHHISTDEVYGSLGLNDPNFTELSPYRPNSPYSASKAASDHLVRAYFKTYGLPTTMSHCSNNFGSYQHREKFIPMIIQRCLTKEPITLYGDGANIRDWLYVEDHCRAVDQIIRQSRQGQSYNLGGGNEWSNLALAKSLCALIDELKPCDKPHDSLITFVSDRNGHDFRYGVDYSKIANTFDWAPSQNFKKILKKTIVFYLDKRLET